MNITEFIPPFAGGLLIGLSAALLLLFLGRIAGISGILWGALNTLKESSPKDHLWRVLFLAGLLAGVAGYHGLSGAPIPTHDMGLAAAIIGGLIVGIGVKLGSGCTSGHGVCGLGRLSIRSLAATLTFMATGIITVFFIRHIFGF